MSGERWTLEGGQRLGRLVVSRDPAPTAPPRQDQLRLFRAALRWLAIGLALGGGLTTCWLGGWPPVLFTPRTMIIRDTQLTAPAAVLSAIGYQEGDSAFAVWRKARGYDAQGERWLRRVRVTPRLNRSLLVDVTERLPLLKAEYGAAKYWLCSDGSLVEVLADDTGGVFRQINTLPAVKLTSDPRAGLTVAPQMVLTAAACCSEALPSQIAKIEVSADGQLTLIDRRGLPILLGEPVDLERKIGALPMALRAVEADWKKLRYLDARNPNRFYRKWLEPPKW